MAVEVVPGVWWLEGTRGCNVYLARATDGSFAVIDAGFADNAPAIIREVHAVTGEADGALVTHVLLTHAHFDHIAAASEVARALGARVALGAGDCEEAPGGGWRAASIMPRRRPPPFVRLIRRGRSPMLFDPPRVDLPIEGRCELLPGIEAVPTPGHTPGSTCYLLAPTADRPGVAFVGDLVISHRDGLARSMVAANRDDHLYLDMLSTFATEAPPVGLAGHGYPVRQGFGDQLRALGELDREPLTPGNFFRRFRRIFAFNQFMWRTDRPRRR